MACGHLRSWLDAHEGNVFIHWCPGHAGLAQNELVDRYVRKSASRLPRANHTSHSILLSDIRADAMKEWRSQARDPKYRGRQFLLGRGPVKVSERRMTKGTMLAQAGHQSGLMARLTRAMLNHAPIGEYRTRFFPHEPINCNECGEGRFGVLQSRFHILSECGAYDRDDNFSYASLKRSKNPIIPGTHFLRHNPTAFSFSDAPTNP